MIRQVARKEVIDTLRDGRFRWGGVVVLALLLVALAAGWAHQRDVAAAHAAAEARSWALWFEQGEKNPHSAAHYGVYAFKPVTLLSVIDQGVDPYVGVATWLEAHRQNPFEYRPAQDASSVARFGALTAAGVLQLLVPLLIILFAFSAISGEREQGTLRQLLSLGLRPRDLVWGKAAGIGAALGLLLVPAAAAGAVALALATPHADPGGALPAMLMTLAYTAYFAVFLAVTLAVSARAPSSRAALVGLLAFWIANALVAPRVAANLAESLFPLPSNAEFDAVVRETFEWGLDRRSPPEVREWALRDSVLTAYGASSLDELPINFAGVSLQASEDFGNQVFDRYHGQLAAIMERQEAVHRALGLAAPLLAVRGVSMGLAGTDVARHWHFSRAAEEHRRVIQRIMNDDITRNGRWGEEYVAGPEVWARVPTFEYHPPGLAWTLANHRFSGVVLLIWLGAAAGLLGGAARRIGPG